MPKMTKEQRLEIEAELWRRGDLQYMMHKGQLSLLEKLEASDSTNGVVNCGRQWGKTYFSCLWALIKLIKNPGGVVKYGASAYSDLAKYVYPTMHEILARCPINLGIEIIESKQQIIMKRGRGRRNSTIDFVGLDTRPDGLRGNKVIACFIDESGYVEKLDYIYRNVVLPTFTHTLDKNPMCLMMGTPKAYDTDFVQIFFEEAKSDGTYFVQTLDDNPLLTKKHKDKLFQAFMKGVQEGTKAYKVRYAEWRKEYYGVVDTPEDQKLVPEWEGKYIFKEQPEDDQLHLWSRYQSMDLGVRDKTVMVYGYYHFLERTFYITHEKVMQGSDVLTANIYKQAKEWDQIHPSYKKIADNNNLMLLNDLGIMGQYFIPTRKNSLEATIDNLRLWVAQGRVKVHKSCTETIGCLEHGRWNEKRTDLARSEYYGHYDALMSVAYLLQNVDHVNPIPHAPRRENVFYLDQENKSGYSKLCTLRKRKT